MTLWMKHYLLLPSPTKGLGYVEGSALMSITHKVWNALTTVIKMNDKVVALAGTVEAQQQKIEGLTERMIRLKATIKLLMRVNENKRMK